MKMKISLIVTIVLASTPSMSAPVKDHKTFVTNGITGVTDPQFVLCRTREDNMVSWEDAPLEECTQARSCKSSCKTQRCRTKLDFRFDHCLDEENNMIWRMSCKNCRNNNTIYMYKHHKTYEELMHGKYWIFGKIFGCVFSIVFNAEYIFNVLYHVNNLLF